MGIRFVRAAAVLAIIASLCAFQAVVAGPATAGDSTRNTLDGGDGFTCAVTDTGAVACWGANTFGQLGDGTVVERPVAGPVLGLADVVEIGVGWGHACALTSSGTVQCWGLNGSGQVGDGTTTNRSTPVDVVGLSAGVQSIAVGAFHTCALTAADGVQCWGDNPRGGLGDGTTEDRTAPVDVVGLTAGVAAISAGDGHSCAITTAGGLKCWGSNEGGGLGDGTTTHRSAPIDVVGLGSGVAAVSTNGTNQVGSRTCAVTTAGGLKCWGSNDLGQIGDGTTTNRTTPVDVVGLASGVADVTLGSSHTCALGTAGGARCWGRFAVGAGLTDVQLTPIDVTGLTTGVDELRTGGFHTCAFTDTGGLKCWGGNGAGQLGIGFVGGTLGRLPIDVSGSFRRPECPTLIPEAHTSFVSTDGYGVGSVITFVAEPGFAVAGPADLTCDAGLAFDGVPPSAVSTSTVTLSPDTGIVGGQTVDVTLSGFAPDTDVGWCYAVVAEPADQANCAGINLGTTDASGELTTSLRLDRFIWITGLSRWVDCANEACGVGAAAVDDLTDTLTAADVDMIVPPPPAATGTITLDPPRSNIGDDLTVIGTGFRPGASIEVFQCLTGPTAPSDCNPVAATATTDGAGGFAATLETAAAVEPFGGGSALCDSPSGACEIAAAEAPDFPRTVATAPLLEALPTPVVLPGGGVVTEGTGGTTVMEIEVSLSNEFYEPVEVPWTTLFNPTWDPTLRADPGVDYTPVSGTVTFAPFQTEQTVQIPIDPDTEVETDELVVVSFTKPDNADINGFYGLGFGIILNDDQPPVVLPGGGVVTEGTGGTTVMEIEVSLSNEFYEPVEVPWTTVFNPTWDPTLRADPGVDYTPVSGTVTFAPFQTEQTVQIPIITDPEPETTEWLVVGFTKPDNADLNGFYGLGFAAILDDDPFP